MKRRITFGSICSGIEAAGVAWLPLGFKALWLSEIEPYPCRVLARRFPETPNLGDITAPDFSDKASTHAKPDIIVGGTPCQAFSVAGLRRGLADERGNLTLRYVEVCNEIDPTVCIWENVPGVLSSDDNAFGCFLGALVGADWPLNPLGAIANGGCGLFVPDDPSGALAFDCKNDPKSDSISPPLRAMNCHGRHVCGGGHVAVAVPILESGSRTGVTTEAPRCGDGIGSSGDPMFTLQATRPHGVMVHWAQGGGEVEDETAGALRSEAEHNYQFLRQEIGVRRLTPRECERLQGFPDDFTLVDWPKARRPKDFEEMTAYFLASGWPEDLARELAKTPDGHRYKALGNSMAVPVMRWLGARIRKALCYESTNHPSRED